MDNYVIMGKMDTPPRHAGTKVYDLTDLVDLFEANEGEVQHIIGKTGNGKTYEGTRRALEYLYQGKVVYTSWMLNLPEFYDERDDKERVFFKTLFRQNKFFRFPIKQNWFYVDIDRPDLIEFIASRTDCIFMLDEGQDVFDARGGMNRMARQAITRTRHMRKTLIIISQRAQAVDVTARANITWFYKCVKTRAWWWPFRFYFKVYRSDEMDDQNYPIWEERLPDGKMWTAPVWRSHFAKDEIYNAYNSWYLRKGIAKSQEVNFEAYELSFKDKLTVLFAKKVKNKPPDELSTPTPSEFMPGAVVLKDEEKSVIPPSKRHKESSKNPGERAQDDILLNPKVEEEISHDEIRPKTTRESKKRYEQKTAEAGEKTTSETIREQKESTPSKKKRLAVKPL